MLIRGTLTLRNELVIAKREALGLSQIKAAVLFGVSQTTYAKVEWLDFSVPGAVRVAKLIAEAWELDIDAIMPESLIGERVITRFTRAAELDAQRLLGAPSKARFILPNPADQAEETEVSDALHLAVDTILTWRERTVMRGKLGLDDGKTKTQLELAKQLNTSRSRIDQLQKKAERKLRDPRSDNPLAPFIRDAGIDRGEQENGEG